MRGWSTRLRLHLSLTLLAHMWASSNLVAAEPGDRRAEGPEQVTRQIVMRGGDHPGYGRLVFDLPPGTDYEIEPESDRTVVRFRGNGPLAFGLVPRLPRNVRSIKIVSAQAEIELIAGSELRPARFGERLVVDAVDPPVAAPGLAMSVPTSTGGLPTRPIMPEHTRKPAQLTESRYASPDSRARLASDPIVLDTPRSASPTTDAASGAVRGAAEPLAPVGPVILAVSPVAVRGIRGVAGPGMALPFGANVGAAAVRRGTMALVVFDERRPLDLVMLRGDPVLADAEVLLLPAATLVRLPLPTESGLRLLRNDAGWMVAVAPDVETFGTAQAIRSEFIDGRVRLLADEPGHVISVPDPLTGGALLVGTLRTGAQAVPTGRRTPEFELLASWQGVAVLALSDALTLRPQVGGFVLAAERDRTLAISASDSQTLALSTATVASRRYDLPALPLEGLVRRLQSARLAAATAAAQARSTRRKELAEALLALGMGIEMHAVTSLMASEDGQSATDPDVVGLGAIAALLSGRPDEAAGIDDERLSGTDEIAFWRAVRATSREPNGARAAAMFAASLPLLRSYPEPLRSRLVPLVAETLAAAGENAAATGLLSSLHGDPALNLARGVLALRTGGDPTAALAILDKVTAGSDRRARAQAALRAVDARRQAGLLDSAQAADALERMIYAWRGDDHEIALRMRVAELRAESGRWRESLALLRETRTLFPERSDMLRPQLRDIFQRAIADGPGVTLPPLELVAVTEENPDLMPDGDAGHGIAQRLADRLVALDLPRRAIPVLERLMQATPQGTGRAAFGERLASLRLSDGDARGALAALGASLVEGALPPSLLENRTLVFSRATAAVGDVSTALSVLRELATPAAHETRAGLLEAAGDWRGATSALRDLARLTLPELGPLDEPQTRLVLRIAAAATQAGDDEAVTWLRNVAELRLLPGELRDMFRVITSLPVQAVADLPRAAQEAKLARTMSSLLSASSTRR